VAVAHPAGSARARVTVGDRGAQFRRVATAVVRGTFVDGDECARDARAGISGATDARPAALRVRTDAVRVTAAVGGRTFIDIGARHAGSGETR